MSMQKEKKKLWFSWILRSHTYFHGNFAEFFLLQIPEMDSRPNPEPKIPQEDLDEEVQLTILWTW